MTLARWVGRGLGIAVAIAITACSSDARSADTTTPPTTTPTTTTPTTTPTTAVPTTAGPTTTAVPPLCRSEQLTIRLVGIQGAAGHLVGSFWIADTSDTPCELPGQATLELLDDADRAVVSLEIHGRTAEPVTLTASADISSNVLPPDEQVAFVMLIWNEIDQLGSPPGSPCPEPPFVPTTARISFAPGFSISAEPLTASDRRIAICKEDRQATGPDLVPH